MKLLTITIPCYNSEKYMEKSIKSALSGKDRVEILIVDDGSTDNTLAIAKKYEQKFPNIIKVIHQENGGHGEAVNTGIKNATGMYFKVLDSDDCLGKNALQRVLNTLEQMVETDTELDMLISDYMYDKQGAKHKAIMNYKHCMPTNQMITWEQVNFGLTKYLLMHSVIYRTKVLHQCGMVLPKHTFYVDNIYVFQPLPYVKNIYYLDVCLYKYFIGRNDQSVNEKVMIKRLDQQYRITKIMMDIYTDAEIKSEKLRKVMVHYFDMMMCVSSILSIREGSKERLNDKEELWTYLQNKNPDLYRRVRKSPLGIIMNLPGSGGRMLSVLGYKISQKLFGFN